MKSFFFIIFVIMFLPTIIKAQEIDVNVIEIIKINILGLKYNSLIENGEPLKASFELFNSGSVGYKARVRLNIYKQNKLMQTLWSSEEDFAPGVNHHFDMYYHVNLVGSFKVELKVYVADEIRELKSFNFQVKKINPSNNTFNIKDIKTYEEEIEFNLISKNNLENILIIPTNCPLGWICEQKKIEKIKQNEPVEIKLFYKPGLWKENQITINILTEDGKFIKAENFNLKRESTFNQFIHDFIKLFRKYSFSG